MVLVVEVVVVAALVGVVLVALAHILEMHFVTCTVWWWGYKEGKESSEENEVVEQGSEMYSEKEISHVQEVT